MVQQCVVRGCRSMWYPGTHVIYHTFPKDKPRRTSWLAIVPLKSHFYESSRICSLHFKASDYDISRKRLKPTAVPFFKENEADHVVMSSISQTGELEDPTVLSKITSGFVTLPSTSTSCPAGLNAAPDVDIMTSVSTTIGASLSASSKDVKGVKRSFEEIGEQSSKRLCLKSLDSLESIEQIDNVENIPPKHIDIGVQVKLKTTTEDSLQKQNKALKQKVDRQNKCIKNMESLIAVVKKYTNHSEIENIIQGRFSDLCKELNKSPTNPHGVRYSEEVKAFALTLHFYSPKAYEFIRSVTDLPHVATLRRSLSLFNCNVGFITEVFHYLKEQVQFPEKKYLKNVALIFDGMSLKQDLAYDQKLDKVFGYIDLGPIPVSDPEKLASEALVFQIVSYTNRFKCPIAYFFIQNSLSGDLLSELIKTAILQLAEINITVRSTTCDGAASNVKALECLGCSFSKNDFRPFFQHPDGRTTVYCILDPAHMLKLARNVLADFSMISETGEISFKYIQRLHQVQNEEGLKFANKLSASHVDFTSKKMNVKLAAQVLSSSVADAIDFLRASNHPDFANSQATTEFLHIMDRLFDLMNSKSIFGKNYKSPLSLRNKSYWEQIFQESEDYLKSLKINNKNILDHPRKTFALGFLINIKSFSLLVNDLCTMEEDPLKYLLTFKCSQDNLEIFFSCVRARGRAQDNPSPLEFRYIMRKMLFRNSIQPSINANCIDTGSESLHIFDFNKRPTNLLQPPIEPNSSDNLEIMFHNLDSVEISAYQENILYYITGFIVKEMVPHISCNDCHNMLLTPKSDKNQKDHTYCINIHKYQSFTTFINRGKLFFPSAAAYRVVKHTDKVFRQAVSIGQLSTNNVHDKLLIIILQHFAPLMQQLFDHPDPDSIAVSELHETIVIKQIVSKFLKIRMRAYLRTHSQNMLSHIRGKRQKLHKTVLFSHV